jgi:hypothetical protein
VVRGKVLAEADSFATQESFQARQRDLKKLPSVDGIWRTLPNNLCKEFSFWSAIRPQRTLLSHSLILLSHHSTWQWKAGTMQKEKVYLLGL